MYIITTRSFQEHSALNISIFHHRQVAGAMQTSFNFFFIRQTICSTYWETQVASHHACRCNYLPLCNVFHHNCIQPLHIKHWIISWVFFFYEHVISCLGKVMLNVIWKPEVPWCLAFTAGAAGAEAAAETTGAHDGPAQHRESAPPQQDAALRWAGPTGGVSTQRQQRCHPWWWENQTQESLKWCFYVVSVA